MIKPCCLFLIHCIVSSSWLARKISLYAEGSASFSGELWWVTKYWSIWFASIHFRGLTCSSRFPDIKEFDNEQLNLSRDQKYSVRLCVPAQCKVHFQFRSYILCKLKFWQKIVWSSRLDAFKEHGGKWSLNWKRLTFLGSLLSCELDLVHNCYSELLLCCLALTTMLAQQMTLIWSCMTVRVATFTEKIYAEIVHNDGNVSK